MVSREQDGALPVLPSSLDYIELVMEGSVERCCWQRPAQELLKRGQRLVQRCCRDLTVAARQGTIRR
jgi:hypothetical protein